MPLNVPFLHSRRRTLAAAALASLGLLTACGSDNPSTPDQPSTPADLPAPVVSSGGLRDFFGSIESITLTALVVDGRTFVIDGQTHAFRQGVDIGVGALGVGDVVVVKAKVNNDNVLIAREIRLRVDSAPAVKVSGRVESKDPPDLVVAGRLVHTNSATTFTGVGDPRSLDDVQPGNQVTVTGPEGEDRSLLAQKVRVESKT